jgi:hypothetical protein
MRCIRLEPSARAPHRGSALSGAHTQVWVARSVPVAGAPYDWVRVKPRFLPASFASLDVYTSELLPQPRAARPVAQEQDSGAAAGASAGEVPTGSRPPRLVALFSAAAHAPAPLALPSRRGALPCPACRGAHALRGPADAEGLLRQRYGAAWRATAGSLRATEATETPAPVRALDDAIKRAARKLGLRP